MVWNYFIYIGLIPPEDVLNEQDLYRNLSKPTINDLHAQKYRDSAITIGIELFNPRKDLNTMQYAKETSWHSLSQHHSHTLDTVQGLISDNSASGFHKA